MHQLEGKSNLTSNGIWNTIDKYGPWELKNFIQLTVERLNGDVWICMKPLH